MREQLKKLTISDVANASNLSTATVDRVINGRSGVSLKSKKKVLAAIQALSHGAQASSNTIQLTRVAFILEAGPTFISLVEDAVQAFIATNTHGIDYLFDSIATGVGDSQKLAELIRQRCQEVDGIVLMVADDPLITRAVNQSVAQGVPVICLTSDLPKSHRTAYVGSDQHSAGATAGYLMGRMLPKMPCRILFVASAPYDCQLQRELGFRHVLRQAFPHLKIEERINSQDDSDHSYASTMAFLQEDRHLDAVYNAAGGNRGIARALSEHGLADKVLFIGHEVSQHTKELLDTGAMNIVLSHEVYKEVLEAVALIKRFHAQETLDSPTFPVTLFTPFTSL